MNLKIKSIVLLITCIFFNTNASPIQIPSQEDIKKELKATIDHIKTMPPEEQAIVTKQMKAMATEMGDKELIEKLDSPEAFIAYAEEEIDTWAEQISTMLEQQVNEYNAAVEKEATDKNNETEKNTKNSTEKTEQHNDKKEKSEITDILSSAIETIQKLKIQIIENNTIQEIFLRQWPNGCGSLEIVEHYLSLLRNIFNSDQKAKKAIAKKNEIKNIGLKIIEINNAIIELTTYTSFNKNKEGELLLKYNQKNFSDLKNFLEEKINALETEEQEVSSDQKNKKKLIRHKIDFLEEELVQATIEEKNEATINNQQNKKYEKEITEKIHHITSYFKKTLEDEKLIEGIETIIKELLPEQIEIGRKKQQIINEQKKQELALKKQSKNTGSQVFTEYTRPENTEARNNKNHDYESNDNNFTYEPIEEEYNNQKSNDEKPFGFQKEKIDLPEQKPIERKEGEVNKENNAPVPVHERRERKANTKTQRRKHEKEKAAATKKLKTKEVKKEITTEESDTTKANSLSQIQKILENMHKEILSFIKEMNTEKDYAKRKNIISICEEYFKKIEEKVSLINADNTTDDNQDIAIKKINFTIELITEAIEKIEQEDSFLKRKTKKIKAKLQECQEEIITKTTKNKEEVFSENKETKEKAA